jgi:hypothetical protein
MSNEVHFLLAIHVLILRIQCLAQGHYLFDVFDVFSLLLNELALLVHQDLEAASAVFAVVLAPLKAGGVVGRSSCSGACSVSMLVISGLDVPRSIHSCGCLHTYPYQRSTISDDDLLVRGLVLVAFIGELHRAQGLIFSVGFNALLTRAVLSNHLPQRSEVI